MALVPMKSNFMSAAEIKGVRRIKNLEQLYED